MTGIRDYQMIEETGGIQWPFRRGEVLESERRLFEDGRFFTSDQRAPFLFANPEPPPERTSAEFPLVLLTGRDEKYGRSMGRPVHRTRWSENLGGYSKVEGAKLARPPDPPSDSITIIATA